MRSTFAAFDQEVVELTYSVNGASPQRALELIVCSVGLAADQRAPELFDAVSGA